MTCACGDVLTSVNGDVLTWGRFDRTPLESTFRMMVKLRVNLMVKVMAKLTSHQTMMVVATAERVQMKQVFFAVTQNVQSSHSIYHA